MFGALNSYINWRLFAGKSKICKLLEAIEKPDDLSPELIVGIGKEYIEKYPNRSYRHSNQTVAGYLQQYREPMHDVFLVSQKDENPIEQRVLDMAKETETPLLIQNGKKFAIYGRDPLNNKEWTFTDISPSEEVDFLSNLPFQNTESSLFKAFDPQFTAQLIEVLQKGHQPKVDPNPVKTRWLYLANTFDQKLEGSFWSGKNGVIARIIKNLFKKVFQVRLPDTMKEEIKINGNKVIKYIFTPNDEIAKRLTIAAKANCLLAEVKEDNEFKSPNNDNSSWATLLSPSRPSLQ